MSSAISSRTGSSARWPWATGPISCCSTRTRSQSLDNIDQARGGHGPRSLGAEDRDRRWPCRAGSSVRRAVAAASLLVRRRVRASVGGHRAFVGGTRSQPASPGQRAGGILLRQARRPLRRRATPPHARRPASPGALSVPTAARSGPGHATGCELGRAPLSGTRRPSRDRVWTSEQSARSSTVAVKRGRSAQAALSEQRRDNGAQICPSRGPACPLARSVRERKPPKPSARASAPRPQLDVPRGAMSSTARAARS